MKGGRDDGGGSPVHSGLDLFFRKTLRDRFQAVTELGAEIQTFVKADSGTGVLTSPDG